MVEHLNDSMSASRNSNIAPGSRLNHVLDVKRVIALEQAIAAYQACHFLGMPECAVHLSQAVVYLSLAPKSNALYVGYERAKGDALQELADPVPLALRNAPTRLMRELDYGKGYQYAHDAADKLTNLQCLPDSKLGKRYYRPTTQGLEARFAARLADILAWKRAHGAKGAATKQAAKEESLEEPAPSRQAEKRPARTVRQGNEAELRGSGMIKMFYLTVRLPEA